MMQGWCHYHSPAHNLFTCHDSRLHRVFTEALSPGAKICNATCICSFTSSMHYRHALRVLESSLQCLCLQLVIAGSLMGAGITLPGDGVEGNVMESNSLTAPIVQAMVLCNTCNRASLLLSHKCTAWRSSCGQSCGVRLFNSSSRSHRHGVHSVRLGSAAHCCCCTGAGSTLPILWS